MKRKKKPKGISPSLSWTLYAKCDVMCLYGVAFCNNCICGIIIVLCTLGDVA